MQVNNSLFATPAIDGLTENVGHMPDIYGSSLPGSTEPSDSQS